MIRCLVLSMAIAVSAAAQSPASPEERIKALEAENSLLRKQVLELMERLQKLGGAKPQETAPAQGPATADAGADPWSCPASVLRMLGQSLSDALQQRGIKVPDAQADRKAWSTYRSEVERWRESSVRQGRYRQSVKWTILVDHVKPSDDPDMRKVDAVVTDGSGTRLGTVFTIQCPLAMLERAFPQTPDFRMRGPCLLRAEVAPEIRLAEQQPAPTEETFQIARVWVPIAPQVECMLRYTVRSVEPRTSEPAPAPRNETPGG